MPAVCRVNVIILKSVEDRVKYVSISGNALLGWILLAISLIYQIYIK